MKAEILTVGSEILLGDIQNTHAQYLSKQCACLGIDILRHTSVGDNKDRLYAAVSEALSRCDLLMVTGGLGPTKDDLTKEMVCKSLNINLHLSSEIKERIEKYFFHLNTKMPENNLRQAMVPENATVFHNQNGTAPGLYIEKDGKQVILLPGPPSELHPLFEEKVLPFLEKKMHTTIQSHNVHIFDIGESKVDEMLSDLLENQNPTVAPYAKDGEVRVRVTAKADDEKACEKLMQPVLEEIHSRLHSYIYGVDVGSLENALVTKAVSLNKTIAVAESCTGGMIAQKITSIPNASQCFSCGIISYGNEIKIKELGVHESTLKTYGAVSKETAAEMAEGIRKKTASDIGVSVTGIAGPSGGSKDKPVGLVFISVSTKNQTKTFEYHLARGIKKERSAIRNRASMYALHLAICAL